MRIQNKIVLSFAIALAITSAASAQSGRAPVMPDEVGVAIALQVAGQPYQFEGKAACQHAPVASIYNVMAEMWILRQIDSQRAIQLTLWHPKNMSGDIFLLSVQTGSKAYLVDTFISDKSKSGRGRSVVGSGKVSFTPSGAGGTFTINAMTLDGAAITGTIRCSAFTAPMPVAGN